ncbi:TPA: peroxiredoxin [Vibrio cholerae]|nr:peroxiredoxin [Vibrio cholerae]
MIQIGQTLPNVQLSQRTSEGTLTHSVTTLFANKKVVLFAVPGAFTPTCSEAHLPGYVVLADKFKEKGVDMIACVSVNDAFVMKAWGDASFTKALGLEMDTGNFGGVRSQRYAMVIENNVVTLLNVEPPKTFELSKAETVLASL